MQNVLSRTVRYILTGATDLQLKLNYNFNGATWSSATEKKPKQVSVFNWQSALDAIYRKPISTAGCLFNCVAEILDFNSEQLHRVPQ